MSELVVTYYNDGGNGGEKLQVKEKYYTKNGDKDGKKEGIYRLWYENGQIEMECNFSNGKLNGLYRNWYKNGQLLSESNYVNNKGIGTYKWWNENGEIWRKFIHFDGYGIDIKIN